MTVDTPSKKLLDKLQKIKAHADSAKVIGSEKEAQAFADMLQKMLLDHNLQMSDLEFERLEKIEPIEDSYLDWSHHGMKEKRNRVEWMELLAIMVAEANFCRILVASGTNNFWLVGRREHRAVAEFMIVTLARALEKIATLEYGKYYRECLHEDGHPRRARGFRESFILGFLNRLMQRLRARKKTAETSSSTALMRINREDDAVENELARRKKLKRGEDGKILGKATPLGGISSDHREGLRRGEKAANRVNLETGAVEGATGEPKKLR